MALLARRAKSAPLPQAPDGLRLRTECFKGASLSAVLWKFAQGVCVIRSLCLSNQHPGSLVRCSLRARGGVWPPVRLSCCSHTQCDGKPAQASVFASKSPPSVQFTAQLQPPPTSVFVAIPQSLMQPYGYSRSLRGGSAAEPVAPGSSPAACRPASCSYCWDCAGCGSTQGDHRCLTFTNSVTAGARRLC